MTSIKAFFFSSLIDSHYSAFFLQQRFYRIKRSHFVSFPTNTCWNCCIPSRLHSCSASCNESKGSVWLICFDSLQWLESVQMFCFPSSGHVTQGCISTVLNMCPSPLGSHPRSLSLFCCIASAAQMPRGKHLLLLHVETLCWKDVILDFKLFWGAGGLSLPILNRWPIRI